MRRCVWSRNLKNEEAMDRIGPQRHRKQTIKIQVYKFHVRALKNVVYVYDRPTFFFFDIRRIVHRDMFL